MRTHISRIVIVLLAILFSHHSKAQLAPPAGQPGIINHDNIMNQALSPRRQGLAVMAALEAKGDQAALEKAAAEALDNGLTVSEEQYQRVR